jgi:UDP-N-acetylglucosamine--N-acetylmuramyl-(pentapeptide) pyrophosphoryl-undecaprenol N-acetylglucosamine transferase
MQVDLATFFTDIPARLASAHLVICRAGASTIAELTAAGRPAILVPYPNAADNHQYANATAIEDADAGWVIPQEGFTAAALSTRIESFLNLPLSLSKVAKQAKSLAHLDAAQHLSLLVSFMIKGYALEDIRAKLAPIDKPKPSVKPAVKKNKLAA